MFANLPTVQIIWKGNFDLDSFDSICPLNYQHDVMYENHPDCTQQLVFSSVFTFSLNSVEYHNVSACNRIVKCVPVFSPVVVTLLSPVSSLM